LRVCPSRARTAQPKRDNRPVPLADVALWSLYDRTATSVCVEYSGCRSLVVPTTNCRPNRRESVPIRQSANCAAGAAYSQRNVFGASRLRITLAGMPATTASPGTSAVTTALVPITALSPTATPRRRQAPYPIQTL
jgi:hypothetical protein